ncbi:MAG: hypothetical protein K0Q55_1626 [Verrucomicrobia bacterium]|jgi:hypothetical protein|nr:hypothetical protein [Verrucomicrobiota bacterium]
MDMRTGSEPLHKGYRIIQLLLLLVVCALLFLGVAKYSFPGSAAQEPDAQTYASRRSQAVPQPSPKPEVSDSERSYFGYWWLRNPAGRLTPEETPDEMPLQMTLSDIKEQTPSIDFVRPPSASATASGKIGTVNVILVLEHVFKNKTHPLYSNEDYKVLLPKIKAATARVGAADDYFLILENSMGELNSRPFLFITGTVTDVTQAVIAELNAEPQIASQR